MPGRTKIGLLSDCGHSFIRSDEYKERYMLDDAMVIRGFDFYDVYTDKHYIRDSSTVRFYLTD